MGNRSYLYVDQATESIGLLEANNSLPFFWLSMMDRSTLAASRKEAQKYENFIQTQPAPDEEQIEKYLADHSLDVRVSAEEAQRNFPRVSAYLQAVSPDFLELYDDFTEYIMRYLDRYSAVAIDMFEYSGFYKNMDEMYADLDKELEALEEHRYEDIHFWDPKYPVAMGSGYAYWSNSEFADYDSYQKLMPKKNYAGHNDSLSDFATSRAKRLRDNILFLCMALIGVPVSVLILRDEGHSIISVLTLVSCLVLLAYAVFNLRELWLTRKKSNK